LRKFVERFDADQGFPPETRMKPKSCVHHHFRGVPDYQRDFAALQPALQTFGFPRYPCLCLALSAVFAWDLLEVFR
jgi:hypothetical protein